MAVAEEKRRSRIFLGQDNNSLVLLFAINTLAFVILKFIYVVYQMADLDISAYYRNIFNWFILPADISKIATRPWSILTYMFVEGSVLTILSNMFWLWVFGFVLQDLTGNKKLAPVYLYGGLAGALVYVLTYYLVPVLAPGIPNAELLGANASVMAVAIASTAIKPDYRFFPMINGGIPLWLVTLAFVILDFAFVHAGDPGRYLAHLAGAGAGFVFVYQLRRGNDGSVWMNSFFDWINDLFNPERKIRYRDLKSEFFYKTHGTHPYKRIPNVTQKRIDEILDKINQEGYHLLTDEEKDILRRASNEDEL